MSDQTMWGIHAGKTGDADTLFLRDDYIGIGWAPVGDLSRLAPTREAFKQAVREAYPNGKPGAVPGNAGQLFRFVHEMKVGDLIAYPSKADRQIHIGRVVGPYTYDPSTGGGYPNLRRAEWLKHVPRTNFSQGALHEIGSAMSLFQIKNYIDEYLSALEGIAPEFEVEDDTVAVVADEIEDSTRDFILKTLSRELKGHGFAHFVAHLLNVMGYRTRVSPEGPDAGIDIVAHRDELGFQPPIIKVQVKSGEGSVGDPVVSALYGKVDASEFGLVVTLGYFTKQATNFARNNSNLRLIDGREVVELILTHYDDFDSNYKGLLPLKRVYVPQAVSELEED